MTLLELLVTLAIIGILASITYPLYMGHLKRARRSEAKVALHHLANAMEKYHALNNSYQKATLAKCHVPEYTTGGFYRLLIRSAGKGHYELAAVAQKSQQQDKCRTISLNDRGNEVCKL